MSIPADIKRDFPVLQQQVHDKPLIYLDSGNTSQKPQAVIDAMNEYYETTNANVHRGSYDLAVRATEALEGARAKVARFINAPATNEVVFTKNATEAFNLLARSWGAANLGPGDAVVISEMEHHANIVPWHMLSAEKGFELRGSRSPRRPPRSPRSRHPARRRQLVSVTAMSNVLGTLNDILDSPRPHTAPVRCSPSTAASMCPTFPPTCRRWAPTSSS